uniref:Glutaminyl-peptide cyclotransferase n=1 Tax=Salmo trutta TaxID=8032 RepID=A0A674AXN7_SALTR
GHKPSTLSSSDITRVLSHTDLNQMWQRDLRPLLVSRYPNSAGSLAVHPHIKSTLGSLRAGWDVQEDTFESHTPYGPMTFNNIIATLNPSAKRRLVLACRYDSKYYPPQWHGRQFLGATDSAESNPNLSLQLLFFDGEEALFQWTATDSLYGSRDPISSSPPLLPFVFPLPHDLFVLLDLIGGPSPRFGNQFPNTARWLTRMQNIAEGPSKLHYFWPGMPVGPVQDDHMPFLNRGKLTHNTLGLTPVCTSSISSPPPSPVWHTFDDNEQNLDRSTIVNLNKILQVLVLEYLNTKLQALNPLNTP